MSLPDLKQLGKIIALCRKKGVLEITIDGVTLKLGEAPVSNYKKKASAPTIKDLPFETDSLTQEQLLMWSVQGLPEDVASE